MVYEHPAHGLIGKVMLLLIIAAGFGVFAIKTFEAYRLIMKGKKEERLDRIPERIEALLVYVLGQLRLFQEPFAGFIHAFIFWGFCVLAIGYGNAIISAFWKGFAFPLTKTPAFLFIHDFFGAMVIISVIIALVRRLIIKPKRLEMSNEALAILFWIFFIVSFDFLTEGFKMVYLLKTTDFMEYVPPVTKIVGAAFYDMPIDPVTLQTLSNGFWWAHMVLIFGFMAYLPHSKHFHIVTAAINVFLHNLRPVGQLSKLDLEAEDAESFGVAAITEYTWKDLMDLFVCTECGRCSDNCPANLTEKPLAPKKVIDDLKAHLKGKSHEILSPPKSAEKKEEGPKTLVGTVLKEDEIWSCTTCAACQQACPVFIEHIPKIVGVRRAQVLNESQFPQEVALVFKNMENNNNPYGIGYSSRADWCRDLGVKVLGEGGKADLLFWVGCAGSFDERNRKVSTAIVKILQAAGIDFAILGPEEGCCGDSARRIGNEYLYQTLAQANVEILKNYGVKRILTHCPHCYNTLKNEYSQFGGDYELIHTTTFISDLVARGKLSLKKELAKNICYHDSCYLGRYNDIYAEPRSLLLGIGGVNVLEMSHKRQNSFCCGAGGGRMWMEETLGTRINRKRVEEALALKPDIISSNCPYCLTMLTDGIKDANMDEKVQVLDLMELVHSATGADVAPPAS